MKIEILEATKNEIQKFYLNDPTSRSSTYEMSKALIAASYLPDDSLYKLCRDVMLLELRLLTEHKEPGLDSWLLGRVIVAASNQNDHATAEKVLPVLRELLELEGNAYKPWAQAYLAIYFAQCVENGQPCTELFLQYFKYNNYAEKYDPKNPGAFMWERVLYLQAASIAAEHHFPSMLRALHSSISQPSLQGAFDTLRMNETDFPAWALALLMHACVKVGDTVNYQALSELLKNTLTKTEDKGDKMIATVINENAEQLWQELAVTSDAKVAQPAPGK